MVKFNALQSAKVERVIKLLREENRIERKGGKRFGYWEVH